MATGLKIKSQMTKDESNEGIYCVADSLLED